MKALFYRLKKWWNLRILVRIEYIGIDYGKDSDVIVKSYRDRKGIFHITETKTYQH